MNITQWWKPYLVTVPVGVLMFLALVVQQNWHSLSVPIRSSVSLDNIGSTSPIEKLRKQYRLRPISELEEGKYIDDLPNGIYGMTTCVLGTLSLPMYIASSPFSSFIFEVHKRHDGFVYFLGYTSEEQSGKLEANVEVFDITIFARAWDGASNLVLIPRSRISKCDQNRFRDTQRLDMRLGAMKQSTPGTPNSSKPTT